jgi:hypothetical protein
MLDNKYYKGILALLLIIVPGAGVAYGSYLLFKILKRKPKDLSSLVEEFKKEIEKEKNNEKN